MAHERDHDRPPVAPPRPPQSPHSSEPKPDRERCDHPTIVPREPVDPKVHPNRRRVFARPSARRGVARLRARPA